MELELRFETDWHGLALSSSRWTSTPEIETRTSELLLPDWITSVRRWFSPIANWLSEDYYVIHLTNALDESGTPLTAQAILAAHGYQIAKIVRGESAPLSDGTP